MIARLLTWLFGCAHSNMTVPIFDRERRVTYVVCTTCGAEYAYDWKRMRRGPQIHRWPLAPDSVAIARAEYDQRFRAGMSEEIVKE